MADGAYFGPELFTFLRDLRDNNEREWFKANRKRYEEAVKQPALRFIEAFAAPLAGISPHYRAVAKAVGGSLFRIHRDTRFSADKTPYKTNTGLHFRHSAAKNAYAPGFYLHLGPDEVFGGGGIWHPDSAALKKIRTAIVERADEWGALMAEHGYDLGGDSLKRPPRGFPKEHEHLTDLKRKDFVVMHALDEEDALQPDFLERFTAICAAQAPLNKFICTALGVPF